MSPVLRGALRIQAGFETDACLNKLTDRSFGLGSAKAVANVTDHAFYRYDPLYFRKHDRFLVALGLGGWHSKLNSSIAGQSCHNRR